MNGRENYWRLLKRAIKGTYVSVEPFHLFRYLDEQAFRFNNRSDKNDFDRFRLATSHIVGRRMTCAALIGKAWILESIHDHSMGVVSLKIVVRTESVGVDGRPDFDVLSNLST
jgi:hypothetical protein